MPVVVVVVAGRVIIFMFAFRLHPLNLCMDASIISGAIAIAFRNLWHVLDLTCESVQWPHTTPSLRPAEPKTPASRISMGRGQVGRKT